MVHQCVALTAILGVGAVASAATDVITIDLTNDTGVDWSAVVFELRPPVAPPGDPGDFESLRFGADLALHTTTKIGSTASFLDPGLNRELAFNFDSALPLAGSGEEASFTLSIDNPDALAFRVGWSVIAVPTPGTFGALTAFGMCAVIRRRR